MTALPAIAALLAAALAPVAQPAGQPAATAPSDAAVASTQPAGAVEAMQAKAVKVVGRVMYAMAGPDGLPGEFEMVKQGDTLPAGAIIQTRLRSKVMLAFGDDTVVLIDRVTMASIDQFHRTGNTKKIHLGLGHGLIRAAAMETTLRSDMTISSPVATLSKRGTMDFGMRYEPGTGRYVVFLNEEGLVELFDRLRGAQRTIEPGQYVTQALLSWIETMTLNRYIPITDAWGQTAAERHWNAYFGSAGIGVVEPGAGFNNFLANYNAAHQVGASGVQLVTPISPIVPASPPRIVRPEGNFGTGFPN